MEENNVVTRIEEAQPEAVKPFWGSWATTGFGLIVIVASIIVQILVIVVFLVNYMLSNGTAGFSAAMDAVNSSMGASAAAAIILEVVVCIPLMALFVRLRRSLSFRDYVGLRRFKVKALLFWLAVDLAFIIVTEGIRQAFNIPQSERDAILLSSSLSLPLLFAAVVVFAPVFEEVLFRGFMFQGYANARTGPIFATIITAAMWASLHMDPLVGVYDLATIFGGGLIFGLARWKTGSLWVTLVMHAFWNLLAFIALAATTS